MAIPPIPPRWGIDANGNLFPIGDRSLKIKSAEFNTTLPVHADNATALGAGMTAGQLYRTSAGALMVVYAV